MAKKPLVLSRETLRHLKINTRIRTGISGLACGEEGTGDGGGGAAPPPPMPPISNVDTCGIGCCSKNTYTVNA